MNHFSLITEPTATKRIIVREGLEQGHDLPPDGWSFEQFETADHRCLCINHREENGQVSHRIITAHKSVNSRLISETFATVTVGLAGHKDCMYVQRVATNLN